MPHIFICCFSFIYAISSTTISWGKSVKLTHDTKKHNQFWLILWLLWRFVVQLDGVETPERIFLLHVNIFFAALIVVFFGVAHSAPPFTIMFEWKQSKIVFKHAWRWQRKIINPYFYATRIRFFRITFENNISFHLEHTSFLLDSFLRVKNLNYYIIIISIS